MVYGIANSAVERNQAGSSWVSKAAIFSLSASFGGLISGWLLGLVGSFVPLNIRIALASLLALAAVVVAAIELSGRRLQLLQCNRETPQSWVHEGPTKWAIQNGLALGCGVTNRVVFWLWYAIPAGAFSIASPILGMVIYGTYSIVRGMAVWVLILGFGRKYGEDWGDRLIGHMEMARLVTTGQLLLPGIVVTIAVGL